MQTGSESEQAAKLPPLEPTVPDHFIHQDWNRRRGSVAVTFDVARNLRRIELHSITDCLIDAGISLMRHEPVNVAEPDVCLLARVIDAGRQLNNRVFEDFSASHVRHVLLGLDHGLADEWSRLESQWQQQLIDVTTIGL